MHYDKAIRYLSYLENGEKIKSAGFVKIELIDELCNIQINVTGLHPTENCTREVHLLGITPTETADTTKSKEAILGEISLQNGKGSLIKRRIPIDSLCEGIGYQDLTAVRINLGKSRELVCHWREAAPKEPEVPEQEPEKQAQANPPQEVQKKLEEAMQPIQTQAGVCSESYQAQEEMPEMVQTMQTAQPQQPPQDSKPPQDLQSPQIPQPPQTQQPTRSEHPYVPAPTMPATLHEKKWRQLSEIYPHISPFHDERDYLSIGPGDFVILPEKYYRLINNSFLLHGFYNYGHMVLARTMKRGEEKYYIGVPGNFYEKERQVAIMFGFESFECRQEPASDGDFGYYMIRVEL